MPKPDCIIDACSYIYLQQCKFNINSKEISTFELLNKLVNIKHHPIISKEIKKHFPVNGREALQMNNREHKIKKQMQDHYDNVIFNNEISNSKSSKNIGEKVNFILALKFLIEKKQIPIFLTDDIHSINSFNEKKIFDSFLLKNIWTSFDVVVYIFLTNNNLLSYTNAINSIKTLTHFLYEPVFKNLNNNKDKQLIEKPERKKEISEEYSENKSKLNNKIQNLQIEYFEKLKLINNLKNSTNEY